ncbi:hypothetical protein ACJ41O_013280 [Fusarium nematophilum]
MKLRLDYGEANLWPGRELPGYFCHTSLTDVKAKDTIGSRKRSHQSCARYPGWITRDWDPLMHGWPKIEPEDSPEALERYRVYYNTELGRALDWKGDWWCTEKSHIAEAIWIAVLNRQNRLEICRKFVQVTGDGTDALDALYEIGAGRYGEEDWDILEASMRCLLRP